MVLRTTQDSIELKVDTDAIYRTMEQMALSRSIMPTRTLLEIQDQTLEYARINRDYKTVISLDGEKLGKNDTTHDKFTKNVPTLGTSFKYTRNDLARINTSSDPFNVKVAAVAESLARDEDIFVFGGSNATTIDNLSALNTAKSSTASSTNLNVSSFDLIRSSLNDMLTEYDTNAEELSSQSFVNSNPIVVMMTPDVRNALRSLSGTLSDSLTGYDVFTQVLDSTIGVNNYTVNTTKLLGATLKKGDEAVVSNTGTGNFMMMSYNPSHRYIVTSDIDSLQLDVRGGVEYEITEKFAPITIETISAIHNNSVKFS